MGIVPVGNHRVEGGFVTDDQRVIYDAWKTTLSRDEQEECDYIERLNGSSHAVAYLAVGQMRLERRVDELARRSVWKDGAKAIGATAAVLAAVFTGWRSAQ